MTSEWLIVFRDRDRYLYFTDVQIKANPGKLEGRCADEVIFIGCVPDKYQRIARQKVVVRNGYVTEV